MNPIWMPEILECGFSRGDVVTKVDSNKYNGRFGRVENVSNDAIEVSFVRTGETARGESWHRMSHHKIFASPRLVAPDEIRPVCRCINKRHIFVGAELRVFIGLKGLNTPVWVTEGRTWNGGKCTCKVAYSTQDERTVSVHSIYAPVDELTFAVGDEVALHFGGRGRIVYFSQQGTAGVKFETAEGVKAYEFFNLGDLKKVINNQAGSLL